MRRYPWLPPVDYRDRGETGASLMVPLSDVIVIEDGVTTFGELKTLLRRHRYHGFPIVDNHNEFVGYATRQELIVAIGKIDMDSRLSMCSHPNVVSLDYLQLDDTEDEAKKICTFSDNRLRIPVEERIDLSNALEDSVIQLRKEVPQELVVNMFQKLVCNPRSTGWFNSQLDYAEPSANSIHARGKVDGTGDEKRRS